MFGNILRTATVLGFSVALLAPAQGRKEKDELRPEKQPNVNERYVESFRKANEDIAELYDAVQEAIDELVNVTAQLENAAPRDRRTLERRQGSLRSLINRERRKLDRILERRIKDAEAVYLQHKEKVDSNTEKAKQADEQGNDRRAQQFYQEAAKFSGPMGSAKRNLDLLYYHCFFKGEEILAEDKK